MTISKCVSLSGPFKFVERSPWLELKSGDATTVDRNVFERFVRAANEYAAAIVESARSVG